MQVLCPITDWQISTISTGKYAGNESKSREIIALDCWNWIFAVEYEKGNTADAKFYANVKLLTWHLIKYGKDIKMILSRIAEALTLKTGITLAIPECKSNEEWMSFAKRIDKVFDVNFLAGHMEYPPKIVQRIFKCDDED